MVKTLASTLGCYSEILIDSNMSQPIISLIFLSHRESHLDADRFNAQIPVNFESTFFFRQFGFYLFFIPSSPIILGIGSSPSSFPFSIRLDYPHRTSYIFYDSGSSAGKIFE